VHHEASLPVTADASSIARRELDSWLSSLAGRGMTDRVRLAASELVSNAVRHGDLSAGTPIRLAMDVTLDAIRVEVLQQTETGAAALVRSKDRGTEGGFGLAIVEDVTDRWGVEPGPPGAVWFEIARLP
jgi:anti-sigma regulatory factor (Ser/Thr protein kinase)